MMQSGGFSSCVVLLLISVNYHVTATLDRPSPILIIPGHSGSVLNVRDSSNSDCSTNGETFRIWVNVTALAATPDCYFRRMKLNYSNGYSDAQGVNITAADFGNTSSVEILDLKDEQPYFQSFVEYFVKQGYVRNVSIRAAPYDWRLATVPGYKGSRLNVQDSSNSACNTNGHTLRVYVNGSVSPECFTSQMKLNYKDGYSDAKDVHITAAEFGNTSSVEILDLKGIFPYFYAFVKFFEERGYTKNVNIKAAPYDWRLAVVHLNQRGYYADLKHLVETMYKHNNNTKVTLVVHSMGGPVSLYFLTKVVDQTWKDQHIHSYITLAGAWDGANSGIVMLMSGLPVVSNKYFPASLYRTFSSLFYLLPRTSIWNDTVLVSTPTQNYTANDYKQLFTDAGYPQGYNQFRDLDIDWPAPNVPTYCFYGLGIPTPKTYVYGSKFPDTQPTIITDDGDNTVNKPSSEICLRWQKNGYPFKCTVFQGIDHGAIVQDKSVLETIASIVGTPVN